MQRGPPTTPSPPTGAVFLSYASQDAEVAQRICAALRAAQIEVWFDQSELRGGDAWDTAIRRQIKTCALFIAVVSRHTHARAEGYFRLEWKLAVDRSDLIMARKAFLLPVVIDDSGEDDETVPDRFREVQWTRLPAGETTPAFVDHVQRLLSGEASTAIRNVAAVVSATPAPSFNRRPAWQWALAAAGACLLASGAWIGMRVFSGSAAPPGYAANSIAVLPFADMSEKHDQEYLADGIAEELLDLLAKTPGLRVTARTSSFSFKGKPATIPEIARSLHVGHILEGSVRRAGDRLRVTTQLIRSDTGEQAWSETYDRELKDVFAVQDEVSAAVVTALKLQLVPASTAPGARTRNPRAYDQYLLGRHLLLLGSEASTEEARAALEEAIRLAPTFAPAYGQLGFALTNLVGFAPPGATPAEAAASINQALALDPSNPDALWSLTRLRLITLDFPGALAAGTQAHRLAPDSSRSLSVYADALRAYGRLREAVSVYRQAMTLDPLDRVSFSHAGHALLGMGDLAGARVVLERANALAPLSDDALAGLADLEILEHRPQAVATHLARLNKGSRLYYQSMAAQAAGDSATSATVLREFIACCATDNALAIAAVYAYRRETSTALEWVERAARQRDPDFMTLLADPFLQPLRSEPRMQAVLRSLSLAD